MPRPPLEPSEATNPSNADQHQNTHWMIIPDMTRRVSSERGGNGARIRAVGAGDPPRIVPAAGLHGDRRNGGAAAVHGAEERGEAEAALAFAASIVESSDDAIVGMTLYGMVTNRNAGAEWLHGYTAREVLGRWPHGITIPEDDLPKILIRVGRGERVTRYETVGVKKNGRRVDVSITVSPIRDTEGKIVGASSIARRITYRRKAAAAHETLEALSQIRDRQADEARDPGADRGGSASAGSGLPRHSQAPGIVAMTSDRR
jgi:PAS domain S-box-containing protein